jgi:serine/threonine protein kinase
VPLTAGTTVGRYRIERLLGSGGMGEVYKAVDPILARSVAIKVLRHELSDDPERLSRFLHDRSTVSAPPFREAPVPREKPALAGETPRRDPSIGRHHLHVLERTRPPECA